MKGSSCLVGLAQGIPVQLQHYPMKTRIKSTSSHWLRSSLHFTCQHPEPSSLSAHRPQSSYATFLIQDHPPEASSVLSTRAFPFSSFPQCEHHWSIPQIQISIQKSGFTDPSLIALKYGHHSVTLSPSIALLRPLHRTITRLHHLPLILHIPFCQNRLTRTSHACMHTHMYTHTPNFSL